MGEGSEQVKYFSKLKEKFQIPMRSYNNPLCFQPKMCPASLFRESIKRLPWWTAPLNTLLSVPVPPDFTQWTWNCRDREVVWCSLLLSILDKVAWNRSKLQAVLSLRMRNSYFFVYAVFCVDYTSALIAYLRERSDKLKGLGMTSGLGPRP